MAISQKRSNKKASGGKYTGKYKKKQHEIGSTPILTKIDNKKVKSKRVIGGNTKFRLQSCNEINVVDKSNKTKKVKIKSIVENPADRHFVRRGIITKGAIVETELGKVKITSRPGQEGAINGVLV